MVSSTDRSTYGSIISGTILMSAAAACALLFALVRAKVIALELGPAGLGELGLLTAVIAFVGTLAQVGIGTAGTREFALAHASGDRGQLRRLILSAFIVVLFASLIIPPTLFLTGGHLIEQPDHEAYATSQLLILYLAIAAMAVSAFQNSILRGMRRVRQQALLSVVSAVLTTALAVPVVLTFGDDAIVWLAAFPFLAALAVNSLYLVLSDVPLTSVGPRVELVRDCAHLLRLGLPFVALAFLGQFFEIAVRWLIREQLGIEELGLYQACVVLTEQYVAFLLVAMATDYLPRLSAEARDPDRSVEAVNHQSEVCLLVGGALVMPALILAPFLLRLLYSSEFVMATDALRLLLAAALIRIAAWPLAFVPIAAGTAVRAAWFDGLAFVTIFALCWVLIPHEGLKAIGYAYVIGYVAYFLALVCNARRQIGFTYSSSTLGILFVSFAATGTVFAAVATDQRVVLAGAAAIYLTYLIFAGAQLRRMGIFAVLLDRLGGRPRRALVGRDKR